MTGDTIPDTTNWNADEIRLLRELLAGRAVVANRGSMMWTGGHHKNLIRWGREGGLTVNCGRGTRWGNPHKLPPEQKHDPAARDRVCNAYADYLADRADLLAEIPSLRGRILCCSCAPLRCHCDILAMLANGGTDRTDPAGGVRG